MLPLPVFGKKGISRGHAANRGEIANLYVNYIRELASPPTYGVVLMAKRNRQARVPDCTKKNFRPPIKSNANGREQP